jgi:hypothetical protein
MSPERQAKITDFLLASDPNDIAANRLNLDRRIEFLGGHGDDYRKCEFTIRELLNLSSRCARFIRKGFDDGTLDVCKIRDEPTPHSGKHYNVCSNCAEPVAEPHHADADCDDQPC